MFTTLDWWVYPLLTVTGVVAGAVDAIAGGGGIITLPTLLSVGLPPPLALGANKLQSSFGSVTATIHYARAGVIDFRACRVGIVATLLGAVAGAYAVQSLDNAVLQRLIPWMLAAIVGYSIVRPQLGQHDHPPKLPETAFFTGFGLLLGFYDGFFGPGAGSFWTMALVAVQGCNFMKATGYTKVMNATSNVAALVFFLVAGKVHFAAGLTMGAGQVVGARIGAALVVKRGAHFVRPIFLTMAVLTVLRLIWVTYQQRG